MIFGNSRTKVLLFFRICKVTVFTQEKQETRTFSFVHETWELFKMQKMTCVHQLEPIFSDIFMNMSVLFTYFLSLLFYKFLNKKINMHILWINLLIIKFDLQSTLTLKKKTNACALLTSVTIKGRSEFDSHWGLH